MVRAAAPTTATAATPRNDRFCLTNAYMESNTDLVRISFATNPGGLGGGSPERLWARRLPDEHALFELHNSPFYAKGVSFLDVVEAVEDGQNAGVLRYSRTRCSSGHSTYRLLVAKASEGFGKRWESLEELGCTYEFADEGENILYALDVPPNANIFEVYGILEKGEQDGAWHFDEGHCGHPTERPH